MPAKRHGKSETRTYEIWCDMRRRCRDPKKKGFRDYGGRGIVVCNRWLAFENFLADMGEAPEGFSIERKNVNGHYTPNNCIWIPRSEQNDNTRRTIRISYNGETLSLSKWAKRLGVAHGALRARYDKGWSAARILTEPSRYAPKYATINGVTKSLREWADATGGHYKSMVIRARDPRASDEKIVFGSAAVDWRRRVRKNCSADTCDRPVVAKNFCSKHYQQQKAKQKNTPVEERVL